MVPILKLADDDPPHLVTQLLPLEYYQCILYKYNTHVYQVCLGPSRNTGWRRACRQGSEGLEACSCPGRYTVSASKSANRHMKAIAS